MDKGVKIATGIMFVLFYVWILVLSCQINGLKDDISLLKAYNEEVWRVIGEE